MPRISKRKESIYCDLTSEGVLFLGVYLDQIIILHI